MCCSVFRLIRVITVNVSRFDSTIYSRNGKYKTNGSYLPVDEVGIKLV